MASGLMSFKNALTFLDMIREDEDLRREVAAIASATDLSPLAELAQRRGLPCDTADLYKAWRKQNTLRQVVAELNRT